MVIKLQRLTVLSKRHSATNAIIRFVWPDYRIGGNSD